MRAATLVSAALALATAASCDDGLVARRRCGLIPAGGCPSGPANVCDDSSCAAVYTCGADERWAFDRACPARDGGLVDAVAPLEAGSRDAAFDAPPGAFGGPGCAELQPPDCPVGLVLACDLACCGCEDLFVCESRGWTSWGVCGDAGPVPR